MLDRIDQDRPIGPNKNSLMCLQKNIQLNTFIFFLGQISRFEYSVSCCNQSRQQLGHYVPPGLLRRLREFQQRARQRWK